MRQGLSCRNRRGSPEASDAAQLVSLGGKSGPCQRRIARLTRVIPLQRSLHNDLAWAVRGAGGNPPRHPTCCCTSRRRRTFWRGPRRRTLPSRVGLRPRQRMGCCAGCEASQRRGVGSDRAVCSGARIAGIGGTRPTHRSLRRETGPMWAPGLLP